MELARLPSLMLVRAKAADVGASTLAKSIAAWTKSESNND